MDKENPVFDYIAKRLNTEVKSVSRLSANTDIEVLKVLTAKQTLVVKLSDSDTGHLMLQAEKDGLAAIQASNAIATPEIYYWGQYGTTRLLVLHYIHSKAAGPGDFNRLAQSLAQLHQTRNDSFGWPSDNYIGSLPQSNKLHNSWPEFYTHERLLAQLSLAYDRGLLACSKPIDPDKLYQVTSKLLPKVRPGLVHGDLWYGNFLIANDGTPYLIDPACYFADPLVDIAMSKLFAGFDDEFYRTYFAISGFTISKEQLDLYQLYYLLVHLNLFGSSYYPAVKNILKHYFDHK
jgi:fructosamine-3-kinase